MQDGSIPDGKSEDRVSDMMARIRAGDAGAETELVERFGPTLAFLARRHTRDAAAAEDLYQETLILALEKIRADAVRDADKLPAFLRALVRNLALKVYRRHGASKEVPAVEGSEPTADSAGPLQHLLGRERRQMTRDVLQHLGNERDRQVLFRFYWREEPAAAICRELELGQDHFYRVLHRARQRFRQLWDRGVAL